MIKANSLDATPSLKLIGAFEGLVEIDATFEDPLPEEIAAPLRGEELRTQPLDTPETL